MKKFLLIIAVMAMVLSGCGKIEESIDATNARIDKLEQETIPSIDEQIAAINVSLDALDAMDKELKGYIDGLQATADNLQEQINATNSKIDAVKAELQGEISDAKTEVLAKLESVKAELEAELAQIKTTIETLKAKDEELDKKIDDLKTYVDTELGKTADWVEATFATLEQYNALVKEVTAIKAQIVAINQSITDLENRLNTKIKDDIAAAVESLNSTIQQKVKEITDAYTNAIKSAKEEISAAYTTAIQNAINALETSLKSWVGDQLSNYYKIAEIDAKIAELQKAITDGDAALQQQLNELKSQLESAKKELTESYKKAIEEAITENNGVINTKIANEIAAVNKRIDEEVAAINAKIAALQAQVDKNTEDIAKLLARIQSVSYVPQYSDGKATVKYADGISQITLDFEVSPKDAVVELAKVWQDAVSIKAVYTQTRAVSFVDMPIKNFETDTVNGIISVTASGENLSAEFFSGTQEASVRLSISDGNSSVTSEYIPMVAKEAYSEDLKTVIDLSINGTANSYIVSEKGHYSFDATIIGNGQNGIIADAGFHTSSASISPKSVSLLWDENSIVSDLHLNDGKVYFTASSNRGNALIAVKDSSDNIIWSWHIWATEKPKDYLSYDGYSTIDRNIGATSAHYLDVEATYGLYFQWGRKDPLRNPSIVVDTDDTTGNITYTIEHPTQLVGGNFYNWQYSNKSEYLWGYEYSTKTIYDPCPVGYKVPFPATSSAAYIYDSSRSGGRWDGELWYPFAGRLSYESGDPGESDERGIAGFYYVNTYSNISKNDTYDQYFSASSVKIDNLQFKGFAESVRCIKE